MGYVDGTNISSKSHAKLGVLCLMGGLLGMHRFYIDKIGTAAIMATLFLSSFIAFIFHPIAWGIILGSDVLIMGVDFFRIMSNDFEDSDGKKISPENVRKDKDPIFGMLFFFAIGIYLFLLSNIIGTYIPAIIVCAIGGIFLLLEFRFIQKNP